jgi:hypothetical protein
VNFPAITFWNPATVSSTANLFSARYASFLAQMVVIRRCNLSCGYFSEYDKFSDPVPAEVLEKRLLKFKELGTFGISLTGGDAPYS